MTEEVGWKRTPHGKDVQRDDVTDTGVTIHYKSDRFIESLEEALRDVLEDKHGDAVEGAQALRFALNQQDLTRRQESCFASQDLLLRSFV